MKIVYEIMKIVCEIMKIVCEIMKIFCKIMKIVCEILLPVRFLDSLFKGFKSTVRKIFMAC